MSWGQIFLEPHHALLGDKRYLKVEPGLGFMLLHGIALWVPMFQTFLGVLIIALSLALGFAQDEKFSPQVTYENVPYGNHPHQVIDFWKAEVKDPAPLVVFIHGGGFRGGSTIK